jgi:membrane fusion protein, multidrug efflux system
VNAKRLIIIVSVVLILSLCLVHCRKADNPAGGKKGSLSDRAKITFPVEVRDIEEKSLVYTVSAVGSVDAFEKVQVTARVSGVVDRVLFSEGNSAKVDQILVEIEPERFRLGVESAQATYDKALASKADAEAGLKRREAVVNENPGLIPGEEIETWRTKVHLAAADVAQTKAALNQANLNLHDAYVRAPFAGILQTRTVQTGAYVETGTVLATLVRRNPLLLRFKVPEREAARLRIGMEPVFRVRDDDHDYSARIVHIAEAADAGTRLVPVTAEVKDGNGDALRPGSFAEITVPVTSERRAPVIPQTAIRPSDRGFLAFVIENDKAVERILNLGMRTSDGQVEVISGVKPGETLVIRGGEALRSGVPVKVTRQTAPDSKIPAGK